MGRAEEGADVLPRFDGQFAVVAFDPGPVRLDGRGGEGGRDDKCCKG